MQLISRHFDHKVPGKGDQPIAAASLEEEYHSSNSRLADPLQTWSSMSFVPEICTAIQAASQGAPCEVSWYGDADFLKLRRRDAQPYHAALGDISGLIAEALQQGPLVPFDTDPVSRIGGYARTSNSRYWVKVSANDGSRSDEARNLWQLIQGNIASGVVPLYQHFQQNPQSTINRIYGVVRIVLPNLPKKFSGWFSGNKRVELYAMLIGDPSYGHDAVVQGQNFNDGTLVYSRYALYAGEGDSHVKGEGHFMQSMGDLRIVDNGEVHLLNAQCQKFRQAVDVDVDYLSSCGLPNSALYLGMAKGQHGRIPPKCSSAPGEPFCFTTGAYAYTVSVFDYLKGRTMLQLPATTYGARLKALSHQICPVTQQGEPVSPWVFVAIVIFSGAFLGMTIGFFVFLQRGGFQDFFQESPLLVQGAAGGGEPPVAARSAPQWSPQADFGVGGPSQFAAQPPLDQYQRQQPHDIRQRGQVQGFGRPGGDFGL